MTPYYKLPRLYVEMPAGNKAVLTSGQGHYLKNVLRLAPGDKIRLFNAEMGEFLASFQGREAILEEQLRPAFTGGPRIHLFAPPLSKDRMDFMIEKAVELGMTDYHPLLTERTVVRKVNEDRLVAQMIEAAEQCERLDIPVLHKPVRVDQALNEGQGIIYAGIERLNDCHPGEGQDPRQNGNADAGLRQHDISILIGPPGGWNDQERAMLLEKAVPLHLGDNVLRAETAALVALAQFL